MCGRALLGGVVGRSQVTRQQLYPNTMSSSLAYLLLLLMCAASAVSSVFGVSVPLAKQTKPDCPYCDSSVFPYCTDKLLHDACCCLDPYDSGLPPQCQLADCSFLHANTCKEHRLITRCCCNRLLYVRR